MRFSKLVHDLHDATVFLDVDGTLVNDKLDTADPETLEKLAALARDNDVYLASNGPESRTRAMAEAAGVTPLPKLRKPLPHEAIRSIERRDRVVVIGDKFLTDGLFALAIGAEFVKVARLQGASDRLGARLAYLLDDVVWAIAPFIALARPHQWLKNTLVFAPLFFAGALFVPGAILASVAAFFAFSFAASAVYALNDVFDVEQDRKHPKKRRRPIAAGLISLPGAYVSIGILLGTVFVITLLYPAIAPVIILYVLLNGVYSARLKHVAVVDILCVASFYIMRIVTGGLATGIPLSSWLILCAFFAALFLIVGKRIAEYHHDAKRKVLEEYSREALNFMLAGSAALAIMTYGIYSAIGHDAPLLVYSTVFVVLALFRIMNRLYTHPHQAETPEKLLFKDPWVFVSFLLWGLYLFWVFYLVPVG